MSKAALKCSIPGSTLHRWVKRYKEKGKDALKGHSRSPKRLAKQKVSPELVELIVCLRKEQNFGPESITVNHLRVHGLEISGPTVWRVIKQQLLPNFKNIRVKPIQTATTGAFQVTGFR